MSSSGDSEDYDNLNLWRGTIVNAVRMKEAFDARLAVLAEECSKENWDGYGALPVKPEHLVAATAFFNTLPLDCPTPDISVDTDGCIGFDWQPSKSVVLSISVSPNGTLAYAGMLGPYQINGTLSLAPVMVQHECSREPRETDVLWTSKS